MPNALVEKLARRDTIDAVEEAALTQVLGPPLRVAAGRDIVSEHVRVEQSTLILSGFTARYTTLANGRRQITEINITGDFIDLHSLLMKQMDHGIVALTDCVIAHASHADLRKLVDRHGHLTRLLWLDTVIDAAIHRQWLVAMGRRSALGHLCHLLCELYLRLEVVGQARDHAFDLPLSQAILGDALGLSTVHVNRLIGELRGQGAISWTGARVTLLDWDRLVEIAEFDPTYLRLHREPT
jgi:CRP-like cAMP-binding protein